MANVVPIPGPPGLPFVGNVTDLNPGSAVRDLSRLADTYGEIFKLQLGGQTKIYVSSWALLNEVCNERRFTKVVSGALIEIRNATHDGLFTAHHGEHNWGVAHRILMPAFGPLSIRGLFDEMHDIASQLVVKWARIGRSEKINVTDDFTRLTLDTIALCAMDTRFNSFYKDKLHPFIYAMSGMLSESAARGIRPALATYFMRGAQQKFDSDIATLRRVSAEVVAERRKYPSDKKDLLNAMIKGRDPKTGEGMSDDNIIDNMIIFLIAGHETTSGTLSFLFYYLIKHPAAYLAAQQEVDRVVGRSPITVEHMSKFPFIEACIRETLRLKPPVSLISLQPLPETTEYPVIIGGKYEVHKGDVIIPILHKVQQDPAVYGEDGEQFRPERMLDEQFFKLPPNSWKPFGNGARACIGRPFAWQEAILCTALLLQNFNLRFDDPGYTLHIKQTGTIKPKDLYLHAELRHNIDPVSLEKMLHFDASMTPHQTEKDKHLTKIAAPNGITKQPLTILYGSNAGTCEALAQALARVAAARGFEARVNTLDSAVEKVPRDQPVVMISSSYEGQPPDNAAHFVAWLSGLKGGVSLQGVKYAVFGCGNHDWVSTFHKVPKGLDTSFAANGATRFAETGLGDVACGEIFNIFDAWQDEVFWPALGGSQENEDEAGIQLTIDTTSRRTTLRQDVREAIVLKNELLTSGTEVKKRHIAFKLPTDMAYKTGDYLAILPLNNTKTVRRVLKRFALPWDAMLTVSAGAATTLPTTHPLSAVDIIGQYVELNQPATKKNIHKIAASIADEAQREKLLRLAGPDFESEISAKRISPLHILEEYPAATLPLGDFLGMLPPMRVRQYSISSSPLADPTVATLTFAVLDTPSKASKEKRFLGVASNYLAAVEEDDLVHVSVKPSHSNFHPPADIENTLVIMLCAGSGLAPFRGFVQERACQMATGRKLAPAYLFIGCGHPEEDMLLKDELAQWQADGVVKLFYSFSRATEQSCGCRHVQDRLWAEREEMKKAFRAGARLYVCGSSAVGEGVADVTKKMYAEAAAAAGLPKTDEEVEAWFQGIKSDRYSSDVFS